MTFLKTKMCFLECGGESALMHDRNDEKQLLNYTFKFWKNNKVAEFFTTDPKIFETWKNFLRYRCILSTFHEDFDVKKMIGKGSFAKVAKKQHKKNINLKFKFFFRFIWLLRKKAKKNSQ